MSAAGADRRELWSWALYDFANSSYTTIVLTAIYNAYFVGVIAGNAPWATLAWTSTLAVSYALVMIAGPLVGAYADAHAAKKRLLAWSTGLCVGLTALLAFTGRGDLALAATLLILSNLFYSLGENLVAAFLPELAAPGDIGRISAWGWSVGYLGGLFSLGVCLGYVLWAEGRGQGATEFVPVAMLITAVLYGIASVPTFLYLRERAAPQDEGPIQPASAFERVRETLRDLRGFVDLRRFFVCGFAYQSGVTIVVTLAAVYAQQAMGFGATETIALILVVNVTAALGAFAFGQVQDRFGHRNTIAATLVLWLAMVVTAWATSGRPGFWVAANLAGLALGASQSAGRALVGLLAPRARRAEYYGLWGLAVRASAIVGPMAYGAITWATDNDHRTAMLATGLFFVAGLAILAGVDVRRGYRTALRAGRRPFGARAVLPHAGA